MFKQFLYTILFGLLIFSCAGLKPEQRFEPSDIWQSLNRPGIRTTSGEGSVRVRKAGQAFPKIGFSFAARSDSLVRIDLDHPLTGSLGSLRIHGNRFCLKLPDTVHRGEYTPETLRPYLDVGLPLELLRFLATPFPVFSDFDSVSLGKKNPVFHLKKSNGKRKEVIIDEKTKAVKVLSLFENNTRLYQIEWIRKKEGLPKKIEILYKDQIRILVRYKRFTKNQELPSSLFALD